MLGQNVFGDLGQEVQRHQRRVVGPQENRRSQQLAAIQLDQFLGFLLIVEGSDVREPLQPGAKTAFRPADPVGDPAQLAPVARQKAHDQVCLPVWIRA